jgi:hypothetical protein
MFYNANPAVACCFLLGGKKFTTEISEIPLKVSLRSCESEE